MKKLIELRWPIGVATAIFGLVVISAITIVKSLDYPVTESDYFHTKYQDADLHGDQIFASQVAFNKLYTIAYDKIEMNFPKAGEEDAQSIVAYKLIDKAGMPVNNALFEVVVTRPNTKVFDIILTNPTVENGIYRFAPFTLPKEGRWDVMARITVDDKQAIYNLKADTRYENVHEF